MTINIKKLLGTDTPRWIANNLDNEDHTIIPKNFWILPIAESEPAYEKMVKIGIDRLNSTKIKHILYHDSLVFKELEDEEGEKLCIGNKASTLPIQQRQVQEFEDFFDGELHFLQIMQICTKNNLPARKPIPAIVVSSLPIFEEDIKSYLPEIYVFKLAQPQKQESIQIKSIKSLVMIEKNQDYIQKFSIHIINLAYQIPPNDHEWIFDQLLSAIRSSRLANFYLELYKIFEFFFPLDHIFKLADKINYRNSELSLLTHCRDTLNWNTNHHTGARSAIKYTTVAFAETCLSEPFKGDSTQENQFKKRALEKLTNTRHMLTHQDFRIISISYDELVILIESLLILLQDAFAEYSKIINSRKKPTQGR